MSGNEDLYKLTNFSVIKATNWRIGDKGKVFSLGCLLGGFTQGWNLRAHVFLKDMSSDIQKQTTFPRNR